MDMRNTDKIEEMPTAETPEDVAVLYSWANLHGAKYRDFSASRREYRAQLRHRALEQAREQELRAQAEAEAAASYAEAAARQAEHTAMSNSGADPSHIRQQALRDAEDAARLAAAERIEAARRAEAAALAEAAARREEREIAEASASARRQAAQYADSEARRRQQPAPEPASEVPGQISDPYTPVPPPSSAPNKASAPDLPRQAPQPVVELRPTRYRRSTDPIPPQPDASYPPPSEYSRRSTEALPVTQPFQPPFPAPDQRRSTPDGAPQAQSWQEPPAPPAPPSSRRPRGYRPDEASGVREIYRGPEFEPRRKDSRDPRAAADAIPVPSRSPMEYDRREPVAQPRFAPSPDHSTDYQANAPAPAQPPTWSPAPVQPASFAAPAERSPWQGPVSGRRAAYDPRNNGTFAPIPQSPSAPPAVPPLAPVRMNPESQPRDGAAAPSYSQQPAPADGTPRRRRQDFAPPSSQSSAERTIALRRNDDYPRYQPSADRTPAPQPPAPVAQVNSAYAPEPETPAWLYTSAEPVPQPGPVVQPAVQPAAPQTSVADTLQQSRERVASRWYALKGVFEQPGQERVEPQPVRQKETRTPVLAVFSLAGGVGKTSLVATLGRTLSSLGEKVLLTDTTSHGLLPFYFGASELRQGTVRTFSPPSGSTDAPIYLVSYDVEGKAHDEAAQEQLSEEISQSSRGTHRILLDLSSTSAWVIRRMARSHTTILVPVAPDMNSVISLQAVEKLFQDVTGPDGRPVELFYLINQFDASLPLHLDVREVLRRQLGDRLLPFVIRRAPAVSEALAEGMTIVDYSPEAPVAEDYVNIATWLRTVAAPATAGFRNVRWSER